MVPAATVSSILMARSRPHSATTLDAIWRINLSESRSTASIPSRSRTFSNVLNTSSSKWAHPPESRFGRSMAVRGGAVLEWTKELRDACRFRRASLRVIKSIISPPYPRAFIGDLDCVCVMSQRRQLKDSRRYNRVCNRGAGLLKVQWTLKRSVSCHICCTTATWDENQGPTPLMPINRSDSGTNYDNSNIRCQLAGPRAG